MRAIVGMGEFISMRDFLRFWVRLLVCLIFCDNSETEWDINCYIFPVCLNVCVLV